MSDIIWEGAPELRQFLVPVGDLVAHPNNPRRNEIQIYDIVKSLRTYGQVRAVCIWENAEEFGLPRNTLVAGHHVWHAAQNETLGWTHVAAIPAPFASVADATDYLAFDNLLTQRTRQEIEEQQSLLSDTDLWHDPFSMKVGELKIHERSVREDPETIIAHMVASLREHGWTDEQVIVANDGTILVGESVLKAAALAGFDKIPVTKIDVDPDSPEALRIMAKSYAAGKQAMVDDYAFAELLKEIKDELDTLEGSGYDPEVLAGLILVSRPASEIRDINAANEWLGLAEYSPVALPKKLIVSFENEDDRDKFMEQNGMTAMKHTVGTLSTWWPPRERADFGKLRFADKGREKWKDSVTVEVTE